MVGSWERTVLTGQSWNSDFCGSVGKLVSLSSYKKEMQPYLQSKYQNAIQWVFLTLCSLLPEPGFFSVFAGQLIWRCIGIAIISTSKALYWPLHRQLAVGSSISLLSPKRYLWPDCAENHTGVWCVYFCSEMLLLFVSGISPMCEPPLRRMSLGVTLPLLLAAEPYRMPSVVFSGTPISRRVSASDQGTPNGARSKIAAMCTMATPQSLFCVKPAVCKC